MSIGSDLTELICDGMMRRFFQTWLLHYGLQHKDVVDSVEQVMNRIRQYPMVMPGLYFLSLMLTEYVLPILCGGRFCRFSSLDQDDFFALEKRLSHSVWLIVRLTYLFVRLPLFEVRYAESELPNRPYVHPLENVAFNGEGYEFDTIVIGSGAGGAPVACELANSGKSVAILESGQVVRPQTVSNAIRQYYYNQGFVFSFLKGMNLSLAGTTVGGTTSINSGTSLTPSFDFMKSCDNLLGTSFSNGELAPYLSRVHEDIGVVTPPRELLGKSGLLFEKGLMRLGLHGAYVLPRNAKNCEGVGRCCFVCPTQGKGSVDLNYLPRAHDHGAKLFSKTKVVRIDETESGVVLSAVDAQGRVIQFKSKTLIIAAGAFGTTKLIRDNKLGTAWKMAGAGFRMHPASKVCAFFDQNIEGHVGVPQGIGYKDDRFPNIVFEGVHTPRAATAPMIQAVGHVYRNWLDHFENVATFGLMLVDRTGGRLSFIGGWPLLRYQLQSQDVEEFKQAMVFCGKVFFAAGARRVLLPLTGIENEFTSEAGLDQFSKIKITSKNLYTSGFHPQGTAAMGKVVDGNLKLLGCTNIFVSDASVLPVSPGVNPQVTIMALSLRLADYLIKKRNVLNPQ